ncbi:MAG TPA: tRNA (N(6)-L-threonylcarbamoyladenosine(37)-C(2))-methylthiotransferase MtaB [Rectinemataceae bacterium]|nr:tRNA (N(6)-L-threonylcarbamoyladenosine(37)-C(2))-methylthiotransferase MtaB [Rectinemataceae bacterium]
MTVLKVAFKTLGCKLNQLETESVANAFSEAGAAIRPFDEVADLYVVNTCTVTSKAEQKARRVIRQAQAQNSQSVVLVTGCYAQMDPEGLAPVHPRSIVLPGDEKSALLSLAAWLQDNWQGHGDLLDAVVEWKSELSAPAAGPAAQGDVSGSAQTGAPSRDRFAYHPRTFAFHSRPSLKVEDGCDNRCAYCRVCLARGPAVSLSPKRALERLRELEEAGKSEVVLTGINLAQYRDGGMKFPDLLTYIIEGTKRIRFRISSYEPELVDEAFLRAFADPRVQPHVHLSVQSGSNAVLRRMARPYKAERIAEAVAALRAARSDPFLACDIIAGFPGETDAEFEETLTFCRDMDFAWIHAFPFSARPGTKAFDMRPKVPERVAGERVARLSELAEAGKARYIERWTGKNVDAILEKGCNPESDEEVSITDRNVGDELASTSGRAGTSSNYLKLWIEGVPQTLLPGTPVRAKILGSDSVKGIDARAFYVAF